MEEEKGEKDFYGRANNESEDRYHCGRYESDQRALDEDDALVNWVDSGQYGFIDPHSQFEADDCLEEISHTDKYPGEAFLSRWRHRLIAAWRLIRHW